MTVASGRQTIRNALFLPTALALGGLITVALGATYYLTEQWQRARLERTVQAVDTQFRNSIEQQTEAMAIVLDGLSTDPAIRRGLRASDRGVLLSVLAEPFAHLRSKFDVTHLYVLDPARIVLLRGHRPDRFGDVIERASALRAANNAAMASGLELGPLGTLTLRVVMPINEGGRRLGFLEVGREVDRVLSRVREAQGVEVDVIVNERIRPEALVTPGVANRWRAYVGSVDDVSDAPEPVDALTRDLIEGLSGDGAISDRRGPIGVGLTTLANVADEPFGFLRTRVDMSWAHTNLLAVGLFIASAITFVLVALIGFVWRRTGRVQTDLAAVETSHRALQSELEQRVADRTASLESEMTERTQVEAQLRQAVKLEAVGKLTGGIAHEFNNLLTVVMGNLELMRYEISTDSTASTGSASMLDEALLAASRGAELTHRLLAYGRRQMLRPVDLALDDAVADSILLLRPTIGAAIEVQFEPSGIHLGCRVDRSMLDSALLNLAVNARDAMPGGGCLVFETGELEVGLEHEAVQRYDVAPGRYVRVCLRDTGSGMPEHVRMRAFDPFFSTKPLGEGTGLGLSTVHGFIHQSGGWVTIVSHPGEGTAVTLHLPAREASETTLTPAPTVAPRGRGERILVVEDDPAVCELALTLIESLGYRAIGAIDADAGREALASVADIELLFVDVVLPGGESGIELGRRARAARADLAVVFATGYANAVNTGLDDAPVLGKPYRRSELGAALRKALEARSNVSNLASHS